MDRLPNTALVIDVVRLFEETFGYRPAKVPGFPAAGGNGEPYNIQSVAEKQTTFQGQPLYGASDLIGREVFCPITIEVDGKDYVFPHAVIGIKNRKNVVMTYMSEVGGSVKELVGANDYEFNIRGFLIGELERFPDMELEALRQAYSYNQRVRLKCALTDIFLPDDDHVLITELDVPEKPKVIGVRDFALRMLSDNIFTLYVD